MTTRHIAPALRNPVAPVAGSLDTAARAYQTLARATGIDREVMRRAGVLSTSTAADAIATVKSAVGKQAWSEASTLDGCARGNVLLAALSERARAARAPAPVERVEPERYEPEPERYERRPAYVAPEPEPESARAGGVPVLVDGEPTAAQIAVAMKSESVNRMFKAPNNTHALDVIARQYVKTCAENGAHAAAPSGAGSTMTRAAFDASVDRMFQNPNNTHAREVIAAQHAKTLAASGIVVR